ncbi:MAG: alpha/beta hydrolase [Robiginitalea sp.]|uniref:alpha/beta fold hydrolase n=1 Tax=Robiginitalea sp. TaxID=1902411 RepID=UPI003C70C430
MGIEKISVILKNLLATTYGQWFNLVAFFSPARAGKLAYDTFVKVRDGRVKPEQQEYLDEARHSTETTAGSQIQTYQWKGPGPRVLLVHGWESNTFRWRKLIEVLRAAQFHVIAFDAPAHGNSTGKILHVPLYGECVEHMVREFEPKYIIGHSMGGMAALYHAHRHPNESVEKVVTIGSPSEFEAIARSYQQMLGFNDRVLRAFDTAVYQEFGYHIHEFATAEFIRGNPKKGLILHDKLDQIAPFHASEKVHEAWENSVLVPTEGLGHSMHQDDVNRQIVDFLKN